MSKSYIRQNIYILTAYLLALACFVYILLRACLLPIFFDEALSYLNHAIRPWSDVVLFRGEVLTNNHLLNTLFMKVSAQLFGPQEWALRLGALLGGILYLTGSLKVLELFENPRIFLAGACVLFINPTLLEIFSAARGYALEIGLLMWGLYYFLLWAKQTIKEEKPLLYALWLWTAATLAHLAFLYVYLSFVIIVILDAFLNRAGPKPKRFFVHLVFSGILLFTIYRIPIEVMRKTNELDEGGVLGFWQDTVRSLINVSFYWQNYPNFVGILIQWLIAFTMIGAGLVLVGLYKKRIRADGRADIFLAVTTLLFILVGLLIILWHILHIKYIIQRRAYYFIPLFWIFAIALWAVAAPHFGKLTKTLSRAGVVLLIAVLAAHFLSVANLRYFCVSPYDTDIRELMRDLKVMTRGSSWRARSKSLATDWLFFPTVAFYKMKYGLDWLDWPARLGMRQKFDFYILSENPAVRADYPGLDFNAKKIPYNFRIIKRYPTQIFLAVAQ